MRATVNVLERSAEVSRAVLFAYKKPEMPGRVGHDQIGLDLRPTLSRNGCDAVSAARASREFPRQTSPHAPRDCGMMARKPKRSGVAR